MDSQSNRNRVNVEGDMLSNLPDEIIVKILTYSSVKQAVETSVLSSRWRSIWTQVPYLNFSSEDFDNKTPKFYKFLTKAFSTFNNQVEFSLNLCGKASQVFSKNILRDACSRNVQKLTFSIVYEFLVEFDLAIFSSMSLKYLSLTGPDHGKLDNWIKPTSMWELPALTTLHLARFTLYDDKTNICVDLFSRCASLKNLTLDNFRITGLANFTICHPHISNLTLRNRTFRFDVDVDVDVVKVVTPRLKNLTIVNCDKEHWILAPDLTSLIYENRSLQILVVTNSLPSLEKADLCFWDRCAYDARKVVNLLQKFYNARFLTVNLEIIEIISESVELIAHLPSPFLNLKTLRIYPKLLDDSLKGEVTILTEVKNYFLDSSPSATLTMVSRKELRVVRDTELAQDLMKELRGLLDQEKSQMNSRKAVMKPEPTNMAERVTQIESYWVILREQIDDGKRKTICIIKLIQQIRDLLIKLHESKKDEMEPDFSSLCAEADTVMGEIVNGMIIRCGEKASGLGVCLHEFATAAKLFF